MKKIIILFLINLILGTLFSCSPKLTPNNTILKIEENQEYSFKYFANGHLDRKKYQFKTIEKDGRHAAEIKKASDASPWSGIYSYLPYSIYTSDGKQFSMDVWMDHIGSFTLKLEESGDGGSTTSITVKNAKVNEWETLLFDFEEAIIGGPSYPKIALFVDLHSPATGYDVTSYFSNIRQIPPSGNKVIHGDESEAIKIVVLGSSTAAGVGPSETRNAWVNRYRRKLQSLNGHHQVINLAVGGYTTYHLLPTGAEVKEGKPNPAPKHNVTKALSLNPDAVIINLPSNDAAKGYSVQEQLENYTKICEPLYEQGIPVWVSTPQGRNMEKEKLSIQKILKDSTNIRFGRKTLDFWRYIAHWSGELRPEYDSGDGIHMNDKGHRLLFEEVWRKDILGLLQDKRKGIVRKDTTYSTPLYREGYVLAWKEEFDGTELDTNSWTHELGDGCPDLCGWGNNEKVWYRPESAQVKDGILTITSDIDKKKKGFWTGSRIITHNKVDFHFGRIDIRAKLPETRGMWPALWMLGTNRKEIGWPACGEIDIMEEMGHIPYRIRSTVHYKGQDGKTNSKGDKYELKYGDFSDDFHVFSMEWNNEGVKFFVDDQMYNHIKFNDLNFEPKDNPFLKPFYLIINNAVGGWYGGDPDLTSVFPQTLQVDYIRYFKSNKTFYCPKIEEKPLTLPKKENLWVYLMAGQSNMAGSGVVTPQDTLPNQRLLTINRKGEWILAKEPLHFHNNTHMGLSCGYSFGTSLLETVPDSVTIALIPCAVGGSGIDQWLDDTEYRDLQLWSNMKSKIQIAKKSGTFKGMIWHQGETDAKKERLLVHKDKLNRFFKRVRKETGKLNLPIVLGELGKFESHRPLWLSMNAILKELSEESETMAIILTSDLDDNGDQVHFNSEALRTMGKRYSSKILEIDALIKPDSQYNLTEKKKYELVWSDEFDSGTMPDTSKWNYRIGDGCPDLCGFGNEELQWYADARPKNTRIEKGKLIIEAHKEDIGTQQYSSARLNTRYKGDWRYGRMEINAKLPKGVGLWPAIWMLPTDYKYGDWPASGEIDIMEHVGYEPDTIKGTVHTNAFNHMIGTHQGKDYKLPDCEEAFHTYGIEWTEDKIDFFVDDTIYFTFENTNNGWQEYPFDQPFYLVLNIAVGGHLGGKKGIDDSIFPQRMEIDYVRVFQQKQ